MADRHEAALPQAVMEAVRVILESERMTPMQKFEAVLVLVHGWGLVSRQDGYDPATFAIPESQWTKIGGGLMDVSGGGMADVNLGMDWVNVGPAAYAEQPTG